MAEDQQTAEAIRREALRKIAEIKRKQNQKQQERRKPAPKPKQPK